MRSGHKLTAAALAASLALGAAACGSGSSAGKTAAGSSDVVIGAIGAFSGLAGSTQAQTPQVLKAWEQTVNAAGGINGHKVRVIVKDVGTATGAGLAAARQMLSSDHPVAIIDIDLNDLTWIKVVAAQNVPVITAFASLANLVSPDAFPVTLGPLILPYSLNAEAKPNGDTVAIGYASEIASTAQLIGLAKTFGASQGVKVVLASKLSSSLPDYTAFCQALKNSGAKSYYLFFEAGPAKKITDQCYQQGVRIPQVLVGSVIGPQEKTDSAYQGDIAIDAIAPFFSDSVPGVKKYRDALAKYAPSIPGSPLDLSAGALGWAGAEMVGVGLTRVSGPVTAAKLQNALYGIKNETLDGLIAPATYTKGSISTIDCWFVWQVANNKFQTVPSRLGPTCAPASVIKPVQDAVQKSLGG